mmetsp:Transcript_104505/g.300411  ORF Transcript_104505/g.300411 Transcript_104505/m.300411 type:complete len:231 (-) Transcript_104505:1367-2059(-)
MPPTSRTALCWRSGTSRPNQRHQTESRQQDTYATAFAEKAVGPSGRGSAERNATHLVPEHSGRCLPGKQLEGVACGQESGSQGQAGGHGSGEEQRGPEATNLGFSIGGVIQLELRVRNFLLITSSTFHSVNFSMLLITSSVFHAVAIGLLLLVGVGGGAAQEPAPERGLRRAFLGLAHNLLCLIVLPPNVQWAAALGNRRSRHRRVRILRSMVSGWPHRLRLALALRRCR